MNRGIAIILTIVIVAVGFVLSSVLSNKKEPIRRGLSNQSQRPVQVLTVDNQDHRITFDVTGHLAAFDKVELFAEVTGILLDTPKRFKEGNRFSKGEVLIHVDDSVYRNNVLAQKSSLLNQLTLLLPDLSIDFPESAGHWEEYLHHFNLDRSLTPLPQISSDQEKYYIASRNIFNQYYAIKSMEETWAKYTIEAPYGGVVSQSNINPGTLVRVGQKLGEFTNTDRYELAAPISVNQLRHIKTGDKVMLTSEDIPGEFYGQIQRVGEVINPRSQTVMVYITSRDRRLRDGMFLTAHLTSQPVTNSVRVDRSLLVGSDRLFAVADDTTLILKQVQVAGEESDHVILHGLEQGSVILARRIADAHEGMKVRIRRQNSNSGSQDEKRN